MIFSLRQVDVTFGPIAALRAVSLDIHQGERVALIGGNGSGKSSLLRVLHGLITPVGGTLVKSSALRQAMLFQRPYMLRTTCANNVALGLWIRGERWGLAKTRALAALQRVGMAHLAGRNAKTLSGGQQQRLALARAWVLAPEVLLLDEPTASLDPHAKRDVEALLADLAQAGTEAAGQTGMTLIFASHNLGQVKRLATRVIYLEAGQVMADLPTARFFEGDILKDMFPAAHLFVKGESS